jgi:hypothetical protein
MVLVSLILGPQFIPVVEAFSRIRVTKLDADELSVGVSNGDVKFGKLYAGRSKVAEQPVIIKNGNAKSVDLKLSLTNPTTDWEAVENKPGENQYRVSGIFSDSLPASANFAPNDALTTEPGLASPENFAIDSSENGMSGGYGIPPEKERKLYFKFDAPLSVSEPTTTLKIPITITAVLSVYITEISQEVSSDGGTVSLPDGASIIIPPGALKETTSIIIKKEEPDEVPSGNGFAGSEKPVSVYSFGPEELVFRRAAEICLPYSEDVENEENLRIFYWDGFEWRLIGGKVDIESNMVIAKTMHCSLYALFPAKQLTADAYRPKRKIITPATVGENDYVQFDGMEGEYKISIYDVTGSKVKTLENTNIWRGDDYQGNTVESGVYIYQFKAEVDDKEKLISGVIAVAK